VRRLRVAPSLTQARIDRRWHRCGGMLWYPFHQPCPFSCGLVCSHSYIVQSTSDEILNIFNVFCATSVRQWNERDHLCRAYDCFVMPTMPPESLPRTTSHSWAWSGSIEPSRRALHNKNHHDEIDTWSLLAVSSSQLGMRWQPLHYSSDRIFWAMEPSDALHIGQKTWCLEFPQMLIVRIRHVLLVTSPLTSSSAWHFTAGHTTASMAPLIYVHGSVKSATRKRRTGTCCPIRRVIEGLSQRSWSTRRTDPQ
jgi:hypothetical protein